VGGARGRRVGQGPTRADRVTGQSGQGRLATRNSSEPGTPNRGDGTGRGRRSARVPDPRHRAPRNPSNSHRPPRRVHPRRSLPRPRTSSDRRVVPFGSRPLRRVVDRGRFQARFAADFHDSAAPGLRGCGAAREAQASPPSGQNAWRRRFVYRDTEPAPPHRVSSSLRTGYAVTRERRLATRRRQPERPGVSRNDRASAGTAGGSSNPKR